MPKTPRYQGIRTGYGLDLAGEGRAIVRAFAAGRGIQYENLSASAGTVRRVEEEVARGKAVSAGLIRARNGVVRWIEAPLKSRAKTRQVLPSLLDIQLPFPLEQAVSHFPVLEKTADGRVQALAVAARTETVHDAIEEYRENGFSPVVLDHEGLALWGQSLREHPAETDTRRVVIYLGLDGCVMVMGRGARFQNAYSSRVRLSPSESRPAEDGLREFIGKVRRILSAEFKGANEETVQWFWTGPGAEDVDLIHDFEESIPFRGSIFYHVVRDPSNFLARGLAVRAMMNDRYACNFRVGAHLHPLARKRETSRGVGLALSVAAALLMLFVLTRAWSLQVGARNALLEKALLNRASALAPGARMQPGQEVRTVLTASARGMEGRSPFQKAFEPSRRPLLQALIQYASSRGMVLDACVLREGFVSVQGTAAAWKDCDELIGYLRGEGYRVPPPTREDDAPGDKIRFSITGEHRDDT